MIPPHFFSILLPSLLSLPLPQQPSGYPTPKTRPTVFFLAHISSFFFGFHRVNMMVNFFSPQNPTSFTSIQPITTYMTFICICSRIQSFFSTNTCLSRRLFFFLVELSTRPSGLPEGAQGEVLFRIRLNTRIAPHISCLGDPPGSPLTAAASFFPGSHQS